MKKPNGPQSRNQVEVLLASVFIFDTKCSEITSRLNHGINRQDFSGLVGLENLLAVT